MTYNAGEGEASLCTVSLSSEYGSLLMVKRWKGVHSIYKLVLLVWNPLVLYFHFGFLGTISGTIHFCGSPGTPKMT